MVFGVSNAVFVGILTAVLTFLSLIGGAVYYRLGNLESRREREQYLVSKYDDMTWADGGFFVEPDVIDVEEKEGLQYKVRKYFLGRFEGQTRLSTHTNIRFSEEFWNEKQHFDPYHEGTDVDVEFLHTHSVGPSSNRLHLRIDSADYRAISESMTALIGFVRRSTEEGEYRLEPDQHNMGQWRNER